MPKEYCASMKFDAFDYTVRVIFTDNPGASVKARKKLFDIPDDEEFHALHIVRKGESICYLIFPTSCAPGTIAHEAWHAVRRMLSFCGAELDNETVAYHLGYLVTKLHHMQGKAQRKKK